MKNILRDETGSTSLLTTIFFILFMSVLTVSFMHIVADERERSIENEVSASALAAAQSGVEDGKRVIVYCANNMSDPAIAKDCETALNQDHTTRCSADVLSVFGNTEEGQSVIHVDSDGDGIVDNPNGQYDEKYDCLFIDTQTESVEFELSDVTDSGAEQNASTIFPLTARDGNNNITQVTSMDLHWHALADVKNGGDGNDTVKNWQGADNNPQKNNWNGPAMLRVEIAKVPAGQTFNAKDIQSRAMTLRPGPNGQDTVNLTEASTAIPNSGTAPLASVKCANEGDYACNTTLNTGDFTNDAGYNYYVRIYTIYRSAHLKIDNLNGQGGVVKFDNVQPLIDVTGHSGTTRRRVIARVALSSSISSSILFPEYAIESGDIICKNIVVIDTYGSDNCQYN